MEGDGLLVVDKETLGVVDGLELLEALVVGAVEARGPLGLGELRVGVVDEAAERDAGGDEGVLKGLDEGLHVGRAVGRVVVDVDRVGLPADEPEVLAVGVAGVGVVNVARDAGPEVEEAGAAEVGGAVEGQRGALEQGLDQLDRERVVGGGGQRLGVERAAAEGAAVGQVHAGAGDGDLHVPEGQLGLGEDDGSARGGDFIQGADERGDDFVKLGRVAVEVAGAGVGGPGQGPAEGELVGGAVGEGEVLDGADGPGGGGGAEVAGGEGEVDGGVEEGLVGVCGDGEEDAEGGAGALGGPEEVGALADVDDGAVVQHVLDGLEVVHRGAEVTGGGPVAAADAGAGEADVGAADVGEVATVVVPEVLEDGADVGAAAVRQPVGGGVKGHGVEGGHADDEAARVAEPVGLERVAGAEGRRRRRRLARAVEREGHLVLGLGERDGRRVDLDALLEPDRIVGPAGVGADDAADAGGGQAGLQLGRLVLGGLPGDESGRQAKERGDGKALEGEAWHRQVGL
ncbi:hypothetical protein CTA1_9062 [Colletotrichum tanaceti]|uniref:Uncharacterized protein n=1 Tax=Colletotrichum tanaceti TaxID=1306861 RepID=A0A4U6XNK1_9PEZI|nr:hypothetical protein CTA1_9062 [Colletotrichum tanaceti]